MESLFFLKVPGPPRWSDLIFHSRTLTEPRAFILTALHRNSHNLLKSLATMASEGREGFWQRAYHRRPRRVARPAWTLAIRMLSTAAAGVRHQKLSRFSASVCSSELRLTMREAATSRARTERFERTGDNAAGSPSPSGRYSSQTTGRLQICKTGRQRPDSDHIRTSHIAARHLPIYTASQEPISQHRLMQRRSQLIKACPSAS